MKPENIKKCSFCGKDAIQVKLISSPDNESFICDECIAIASEMLKEFNYQDLGLVDLKTPEEIKKVLDEYVVGQDEAKRVLSVAVYNHYKRINYNLMARKNKKADIIDIDKSNVLMIGPTGSGKTLLAKTLAKILNVPFAQADATTLTEAGYVGEDVENILLKLIQAADDDIKLAERGIIYIDEIDKITKKSENRSITRDVSGEGVQQALLKILESTEASVPPQGGRKHPHQELLKIDTTNILFICGGAFVGLNDIISKRKNTNGLGFNSEVKSKNENNYEMIKDIQPQDLIKFGLIPEFVGRLPIVVGLNDLNEDALVQIMVKPKNSIIKQYKALFKMDGVDLDFEDEAIREIAKKSIKLKTGARGLRTILEEHMLKLMFKVPSDKSIVKITITKDCITSDAEPIITTKPIEEILKKDEIKKFDSENKDIASIVG